MTHDELLTKIDEEVKNNEFACSVMAGAPSWILSSLRAVVEYHKPYESKHYGLLCRGCDEDPNYPCGTILAIEKELA